MEFFRSNAAIQLETVALRMASTINMHTVHMYFIYIPNVFYPYVYNTKLATSVSIRIHVFHIDLRASSRFDSG